MFKYGNGNLMNTNETMATKVMEIIKHMTLDTGALKRITHVWLTSSKSGETHPGLSALVL